MPASSVPSDSEDSDGFIITNHPTRDHPDRSPLSAKELAKVREWLEPTAYDISGGEYRKHTSSHLSGTGSWLTASSEYQQWLTGEDHGLLWIKGIPGSGKSVMAAKIIADLTASEPKSPVLYFFFRQIIDANHEPSALLRDWMDQLLRHSPTLQRQLHSHVKGGDSWKSVSQDDMWKYLKSAFASLSETVYCVTDALDEMDQGNDAFLQALANLGHWRPDKVKVLITSRPVPSVETPLHLVPCLKIRLREEEVDNDISRFVTHSLESSQIDQKYWPEIVNAVPGRANGLFLYARLAMDAFLEPGADVEASLAHLPTDLNILYTNLLREHVSRSGVDEEIQKLILQAATHATRPLRLLEAAEMLGVVDGQRDLKARKELVKTACGPLLEILADETVSVIHHSFTEYLKGTTRPQADGGYSPLASGAAHERLASACLRYLCSGILDNFPDDCKDVELHEDGLYSSIALWKKHPFLKYAAYHWFDHVVAACSASSDDTRVLAETCQLLENDSWRRASCHLGWNRSTWDGPKAHVAASLGLTGYIKELIRRGEDIDAVDGNGRTPLLWAAKEGHADTVQVLIAAGARLEGGKSIDGYKPLHQAAQENHFSVVEVLLRAGVSPMVRKIRSKCRRSRSPFHARYTLNDSQSPLRCACANGHLETVSVMVKYITNLGTIYWALAWAACSGQSRLVSLLLKYPGVDVNARVRGDTFLYLACHDLDFETIDVLLQAGADPTVLSIEEERHMTVDTDYVPEPTGFPTQSCLRAVTDGRRMKDAIRDPVAVKRIEKLFSDCFLAGLNVDQRDRAGQTLLHRVAGSVELIQLLLSKGADAKAVDDKNKTPLHFAWNLEAASILVEVGGADVNAMDMRGQTPLHGAVLYDYKLRDRAALLAFISKLLEYGADPNIVDNEGCTVLHLLSRCINADATFHEHIALLLRSGADPNLKNHEGLTPLRKIETVHTAGQAVDCLVQAGADIDSRDNTGSTALFKTVGQVSSISGVRFFLKAGASKRSRDFQGRTMAHQAIRAAICKDRIDDVVQWLYDLEDLELVDLEGADLEAVDNAGNGLLHELCSLVQNKLTRRTVEAYLVRLLTESGLDVSQKNHAGHTPLHLLCTRPCEQGGSWCAFDLAIAHAIHRCKNIDERDSSGNTPLHIASAYEHTWCKLLLDAGADPTLRNHDGLTPLHLAARCKQSNVVGMLLKAIHDRLGDTPSKETAVINATVLNSWYGIDEPTSLTPLFYACQSGRPESVRLLLDAGADPNIGNLFVACAMMEQENRLWNIKNPPVAGEMVALGLFDTKRPPVPHPTQIFDGKRPRTPHPTDLLNPFASTRLEEILDMLISAGIEISLLDSDPSKGDINPFSKAASLHSDYAYRCLDGIKTKHREKKQGESGCVRDSDPMRGLSILDGRMVALRQDESERMIKQSGWLQPEGVDFEIFRAIIVRRQYHLIAPMIEAGCRFLLPGIPHLQYLIVHGLASVFDEIAEAETQSWLSEGEWHAFGDPSKPGLHFQPKVQEDEPTEDDRQREGELRNKMLEYAVCRALPNMEIVELLVSKYAVNINEGHGGNSNNTALHATARGHHWWQGAQALPFLIKSGADIESRNSSGQTPLHVALDQTQDELGKLGPFHKDVAEALINAGADTNAINSTGQSCLDVAAYSIDLIDLLVSNGAVIHASSLFSALKGDNSAALERLLNGGADANGRVHFVKEHPRKYDDTYNFHLCESDTFDGAQIPRHEMAPVYYLASKSAFPEYAGMRSCFRKLLEHGADIYATFQVQPVSQSSRGQIGRGDYDRRLGLVDEHSSGRDERSVLHELVRLGKLSKYIIDAVKIDPDSRDPKGRTLLHAVCDSTHGPDSVIDMTTEDDYDGHGQDEGEEEVADEAEEWTLTAFQQLLDLGCDIRARDNDGQSVVHHMIYRGWRSPETLGCLEKSMAEVARLAPELLNAPNASGNTPFHYSALLTASARGAVRFTQEEGPEVRRTWQTAMVSLTRLLLRLGASPAGVNDGGNGVLHLLAPNLDRYDVTALFTELVRDHGLDVNARNGLGETPLTHLANRKGTLRRLCGYEQYQLTSTLDNHAAPEAVAALKALGADFAVVDARTGDSLLHLAATDTVQLFKAVMDCGGLDPTKENMAHQTAIDVAATYNNNEILALFEKKV